MLAMVACEFRPIDAAGSEMSAAKPMGTQISLTLTGYNYTNRYIDQFSVDGQGGGNLYVSGPLGGGGGSVCCVPYIIGAGAWKTMIRWQVGGCRFDEIIDSGGQTLFQVHPVFKEIEVHINPSIPDNPRYFEVHFFPDGHAEAAITEYSSPPRLILSKDREDRSPYRQCLNNKKPE
ncbi:DUF3304 domain-containing protein [Massilia glaciei]|uniref:DUF3304 domain-containing protein n=2 Tax=Massilia glaciei TaxID=1524097 RepID=A0A2U2HPA7_9BURK|nr:DUF3304 domain-containing protein [Massilia glaciei]